MRWLASKFLSVEHQEAVGVQTGNGSHEKAPSASVPVPATGAAARPASFRNQADAPPCHYCGTIMTRNGSCYRCANCGSTSGCS